MAEFGDVRDRSADFDSAEEHLMIVDILDDEDDTPVDTEGQSGEEWQSLDIAEEAEISRVKSMKRTSAKKDVVASGAKRTRVSLGGSTKVNVSPHQRVEEFPDEMLVVSSGKLYCEACKSTLALKKSIVKDHVGSDKHEAGKERQRQQGIRQQRLAQSWEAYVKHHDLAGTGLTAAVPAQQRMRRIETTTAMMKAGIPLAKVDILRPLLEEDSDRLTYSTHLASYVPFILENEQATLKDELKEKPYISIIFDGSTYQGEMLVILLRYVNMNKKRGTCLLYYIDL